MENWRKMPIFFSFIRQEIGQCIYIRSHFFLLCTLIVSFFYRLDLSLRRSDSLSLLDWSLSTVTHVMIYFHWIWQNQQNTVRKFRIHVVTKLICWMSIMVFSSSSLTLSPMDLTSNLNTRNCCGSVGCFHNLTKVIMVHYRIGQLQIREHILQYALKHLASVYDHFLRHRPKKRCKVSSGV